ncbi:sugar kinase [Roseicyclus sp.]|uniref:sugar kinase n=1 Tax=Roseicyclus sp. TaxID=1914329 RepID=UPI003F6D92DC
MRFLAIGECMAELAPAETPGAFRLGFAGDTFNTAWYLARLRPDAFVAFCSAVGTDPISDKMTAFMAAAGIDTTHLRQVPDRTVGLYLISLDNGERSFSYWRGQSAARGLADDPAALDAALAGADLIYVSGITLAILSAPARRTLLDALARARGAGQIIAFDPNLRPRLWADRDEMTRTIMQGAAASDIVLPSFEDEAVHFGDADPIATTARYAAAGAKTVIVKNGASDVTYLDSGIIDTVTVAPLAQIIDTTAAGDSFNAVIFAGLGGETPLADTIARACRLAGQVVQAKGALVPVNPADCTP